MSAYAIFIREKTVDPAELAIYGQKAGATVQGYAHKVLAACGKHEVLEGPAVEGIFLMEFPDIAAAKDWYNSPAYREAREHRFKGAVYRVLFVEGV